MESSSSSLPACSHQFLWPACVFVGPFSCELVPEAKLTWSSPEITGMCPYANYNPETGSLWDQTNHCPKEGCEGNTKWWRGGNKGCSFDGSLLLSKLSYAVKLSSLRGIWPISTGCLMQRNRQFQNMLHLIPKYGSKVGQVMHAQTVSFAARSL